MAKQFKVSFMGVGNMGEAMIKGLLSSGVSPKNIFATDLDKKRLDFICKKYKVNKAKGLKDIMAADAAVVAVKPQSISGLFAQIADKGTKLPLIISIAAGVKTKAFLDGLGKNTRVVRVMPNTPALIGEGVSAFFAGENCKAADVKLAENIVSALGPCHQVTDESLIDAVTGLSGSGPAYVFVFIEALADAGVKMGLARPLALSLAANTVAGAAKMVVETGEHPGVLKDKVASPGGTTIAGLCELERAGFRAAAINAVEAATKRSRELGE